MSNEFFPSQNTPKSMSAGASAQTPLPHWGANSDTPEPQLVSREPLRSRRGMEGRE